MSHVISRPLLELIEKYYWCHCFYLQVSVQYPYSPVHININLLYPTFPVLVGIPKPEPDPGTPEQRSVSPTPLHSIHTPSPIRDAPSPVRGSGVTAQESPSYNNTKPQYHIEAVNARPRRLAQEPDVKSSRSTLQPSQSVTLQQQANHTVNETVQDAAPSHQSVTKVSTVTKQMADPSTTNGLPASFSGQSVLSKPVNYDVSEDEGFTTEDKVKDRVTLKHWDPVRIYVSIFFFNY